MPVMQQSDQNSSVWWVAGGSWDGERTYRQGWYFRDESEVLNGPHPSEDLAITSYNVYLRRLEAEA